MRLIVLALAVPLGTIACAPVLSEAGLCAGLRRPMAELARGLEAHPETHADVGEPGTDVVIGFEGGCP